MDFTFLPTVSTISTVSFIFSCRFVAICSFLPVSFVSIVSLPTPLVHPKHGNLEKAIGFCLRKGKAGGEPSPTETKTSLMGVWPFFDICVQQKQHPLSELLLIEMILLNLLTLE